MAKRNIAFNFGIGVTIFIAALLLLVITTAKASPGSSDISAQGLAEWEAGHATFYKEAPGGACDYSNDQIRPFYAQQFTTALSSALFGIGGKCGACLLVKCVESKWCLLGSRAVKVTVTDFCHPNYALPNDNGGWCNPPLKHLDMSIPAFENIAVYQAGIVPVLYTRTNCDANGGIRFTMTGNPYFVMVLAWNVGGDVEVVGLSVAGRTGSWVEMTRNWGQNWVLQDSNRSLQGTPLSFRVTTSDGKTLQSMNVAPSGWQFGQTFTGQSS